MYKQSYVKASSASWLVCRPHQLEWKVVIEWVALISAKGHNCWLGLFEEHIWKDCNLTLDTSKIKTVKYLQRWHPRRSRPFSDWLSFLFHNPEDNGTPLFPVNRTQSCSLIWVRFCVLPHRSLLQSEPALFSLRTYNRRYSLSSWNLPDLWPVSNTFLQGLIPRGGRNRWFCCVYTTLQPPTSKGTR